MNELLPTALWHKIVLALVLWLICAFVIAAHRHGAQLVGGAFFAAGLVFLTIYPVSPVPWLLLLVGVLIHGFGRYKYWLRKRR